MSEKTAALIVVDEDGTNTVWNTAPDTPMWREVLQEQADAMRERAFVIGRAPVQGVKE